MRKKVEVDVVGYELSGFAELSLWGGGRGEVSMDPVRFKSLPDKSEIALAVNDGRYGCEKINNASVILSELHSNGGRQYLKSYELRAAELRKARRGV